MREVLTRDTEEKPNKQTAWLHEDRVTHWASCCRRLALGVLREERERREKRRGVECPGKGGRKLGAGQNTGLERPSSHGNAL